MSVFAVRFSGQLVPLHLFGSTQALTSDQLRWDDARARQQGSAEWAMERIREAYGPANASNDATELAILETMTEVLPNIIEVNERARLKYFLDLEIERTLSTSTANEDYHHYCKSVVRLVDSGLATRENIDSLPLFFAALCQFIDNTPATPLQEETIDRIAANQDDLDGLLAIAAWWFDAVS